MKTTIRRAKPSARRWARLDIAGVRRALRALMPEPKEATRSPGPIAHPTR